MRLNYVVCFRFNSRDYYLLWQSGGDEPDCFVTQPGQTKLLWGITPKAITTLAAQHQLLLSEEECALMNLDATFRILNGLRPNRATSQLSCKTLFDVWNSLEDLAYSLGIPREIHEGTDKEVLATAYDKAFWGINLPCVTPSGKSYSPIYRDTERKAIRRYLRQLWKNILSLQPFS